MPYALQALRPQPTKIKELEIEAYYFSADFTVIPQSEKINAMEITAARTPGNVVISAATVKLDLPLKKEFLC